MDFTIKVLALKHQYLFHVCHLLVIAMLCLIEGLRMVARIIKAPRTVILQVRLQDEDWWLQRSQTSIDDRRHQ